MDDKNQIVLSLFDLLIALRKKAAFLLLCGLFFAFSLFFMQLRKPIHYTAEGIFKGGAASAPSNLSKALEFFGGESYNFSEDPKTFLHSYPVMESVVKKLSLQAKLSDGKHQGRLSQLWTTWKAERWHSKVKKCQPDTRISSGKEAICDRPFTQENPPLVECALDHYSGIFSKNLAIVFYDKEKFHVFEGKQKLGKGKVGIPFQKEDYCFTLRSIASNLKRKKFTLTLIPLYAAAKSLEEAVVVKRDKENPSLFRIRLTHSDPKLAQMLVNATMQEFQNYLREEGKQKINKQLSYLKQRQKEAIDELEVAMEHHKHYLEKHVEGGGMVLLEKELEFFAKAQEDYQSKLREVETEIGDIAKNHPKFFQHSFFQLKQHFKEAPALQTLSLQTARTLLCQYQNQLDQIAFEKEAMQICVTKLAEPNFDSMAYSKLINDAVVQERFGNIHKIERSLVDEKNFSEKERINLKSQLETEKEFLSKKLSQLIIGCNVQASLIKERILSLHENLLALLFSQHESLEKSSQELRKKAELFPEKWLTEQKITLDAKLHCEVMESISKIIETKNIGYHLEYSNACPLVLAPLPLLPDPPKLYFAWFAGFATGMCIAILLISCREAYLGRTASSLNLKSLNKLCLGTFIYPSKLREKNTLKRLAYQLKEKKRILVLSKRKNDLAECLAHYWEAKGEHVYLGNVEGEEGLSERKKIKAVVHSLESIEAIELIEWSDQVVFVRYEERLKDLGMLPDQTIFVFSEIPRKPTPPFVSLKKVSSYIETLKKRIESLSRL